MSICSIVTVGAFVTVSYEKEYLKPSGLIKHAIDLECLFILYINIIYFSRWLVGWDQTLTLNTCNYLVLCNERLLFLKWRNI